MDDFLDTSESFLLLPVTCKQDSNNPSEWFVYPQLKFTFLCSMLTGKVVLQAAILTAVAVIGLTIFTFWAAHRGHDFTFMYPFLAASLLVLLAYLIIQVIFFPAQPAPFFFSSQVLSNSLCNSPWPGRSVSLWGGLAWRSTAASPPCCSPPSSSSTPISWSSATPTTSTSSPPSRCTSTSSTSSWLSSRSPSKWHACSYALQRLSSTWWFLQLKKLSYIYLTYHILHYYICSEKSCRAGDSGPVIT